VKETRFFPRRAVMYVPACDERKTRKVTSLNVDTVVFDIEDGVAVNQKVGPWHVPSLGAAELREGVIFVPIVGSIWKNDSLHRSLALVSPARLFPPLLCFVHRLAAKRRRRRRRRTRGGNSLV